MTTPTTSRSTQRLSRLAGFIYLWVMVGMLLGTFVLLLPVRWILNGMERLGWAQMIQNVVLLTVIVIYVIISWFITRWLRRRMYSTRSLVVRYTIPTVMTVLAVTVVWLWSNPGALFASLAGGTNSSLVLGKGAIWEFGRYPDDEMLERFKREGYTAVITLEHAADLVEARSIHEEREAAKRIGLHLIEAPMLPWVSNNRASLDLIRSIAKKGTGRYYVHCGLGRDRVNLVKKMIEGMGGRTVTTKGYSEGHWFDTRIVNFAGGELGTFGDEKWIVPYPDEHEMLSNFIQGRRFFVLLALDTTDAEQKGWHTAAVTTFREYAIRFEDFSTKPNDAVTIGRIVARIATVKGPAAVVVPTTQNRARGRPGSEIAGRVAAGFALSTKKQVRWTTNAHYVPGQPVDEGDTEMMPPISR